jgi:hypothetical protein
LRLQDQTIFRNVRELLPFCILTVRRNQKLSQFRSQAREDLGEVQAKVSLMEERFKSLAKYFGEDPATFSANDFFSNVNAFVDQFDQSVSPSCHPAKFRMVAFRKAAARKHSKSNRPETFEKQPPGNIDEIV